MATYAQNTDSSNSVSLLTVPIIPPYQKIPEKSRNSIGLQKKSYFTTGDVSKVLKVSPDTIRYRFRKGYYTEVTKVGGKRRFSENEIVELIEKTKELIKKGVFRAG